MKKTNLPALSAGILLLGAAATIAAWPGARDEKERSRPVSTVRVAEVTSGADHRLVRSAGVVRAADRAELSFVVSGRIASRPVEVGDTVRRGQVLASLETKKFLLAEAAAGSSLEEIEVRLDQAERDEKRIDRLRKAKAATEEEVEKTSTAAAALRAAREVARVYLDDARRVLAETRLEAPFAGTIVTTALEPGEWASPGRTVIEIAGTADFEVELEVSEAVVSDLVRTEAVKVKLPMSGAETHGRVLSVARAAAGAGRLFPVVVGLEPHPNLLPGTTVDVFFEVWGQEGLSLPLGAVLNPGSSRPSVFCVRNDRAERVFVDLGLINSDRVAVTAELEISDMVVVAGHTSLADGDSVEVSR